MIRKRSLYAAIATTLFVVPFSYAAKPVTEMKEAVVTDAPSAKALGGAEFATKGNGPMLIALGAPSLNENRALKLRRETQVSRGWPIEIGFRRNVPNASIALGKLGWEATADGRYATRFTIASDTAVAMRSGISLRSNGRGNPAAVTLRFGGNDGRVFEQNGLEFAGKQLGWSPVTMGDRATVEVVLAKGQRPENFSLSVQQISHLDTSPVAGAALRSKIVARIGESGTCNKDVVCRVNPTTGFLNAQKAVASMAFVKNGSTYVCTGTLLNNSFSPKKRLFWTGAHCIGTQAIADTLVTYWFYKATTCGGSTEAPGWVTLDGGAFIRHIDTTRDTLLLELKNAPPTGAVYAGWNSTAIASTGTSIVGIHHPGGDVQKYSLGSVTALSNSAGGYTPLYSVVWNTGVTEGGSSGSALFTVTADGSHQVRGGLVGGGSSCSSTDSPDNYSKLSGVWSSISKYFNP